MYFTHPWAPLKDGGIFLKFKSKIFSLTQKNEKQYTVSLFVYHMLYGMLYNIILVLQIKDYKTLISVIATKLEWQYF